MSETKAPDPTGSPQDRRKLGAVLYADMVGYSRLIGLDDAGTLQRLRALRQNLIDPAIEEHGGTIVQTGGDSLLMVFDSIDGAVRCAVKVQQQVPILDADQPSDLAIRFRVGINLGDAIADGTDLHGDAVNVVARLQAECPPGGICVSRSVRDHVHGRLDLAFEELGSLNLKNISRPVEAFVLKLDEAAATPKSVERPLMHGDHGALPLPDRPSIAVLAFTNMSGDPEKEYFADGMVEKIITALSRIPWLFVIARRYLSDAPAGDRRKSIDFARRALEVAGDDPGVLVNAALPLAYFGEDMDWCDGTALMHLARRSFALHAELAEERVGDWGYRRMTTYGGIVGRRSTSTASGAGPGWVSTNVSINGQLGSTGNTAQVQPAAFTAGMMRGAEALGAELRLGSVTGLLRRGGDVVGVDLDGEAIEGDAVVIAMGPWSVIAAQWLSLPPVFGLKGHSLVFGTGAAIPSEALFLEYAEATGSILSPEIFPRADGTTYVCAISSDSPLPTDPDLVVPDDGAIDRLKALCGRISPILASSRILSSQACFRPVTQDGLPLIGAIPRTERVCGNRP